MKHAILMRAIYNCVLLIEKIECLRTEIDKYMHT